jgi:hypothetical protein
LNVVTGASLDLLIDRLPNADVLLLVAGVADVVTGVAPGSRPGMPSLTSGGDTSLSLPPPVAVVAAAAAAAVAGEGVLDGLLAADVIDLPLDFDALVALDVVADDDDGSDADVDAATLAYRAGLGGRL